MDPRTQTQEEAALLRRIAEEIVEPELMQQLETLDATPQTEWAAPEKTPQSDNPASEEIRVVETPKSDGQPAPAETTKTATDLDWESFREPNGLILGKYKDPLNAVKGVGHAVNMAKQAFSENEALKQEIERLRQIPQTAPTPAVPSITDLRLPKAEISRLDTVLERIVSDGGTIDEAHMAELRDAFSEQSKSVAASTVEEILNQREAKLMKDNQAWNEVDNHMRLNFPDSLRFTDEIGLFTKADPLYGPAVRALISEGRLVQAAELAWKGYNSAQNSQVLAAKSAEDSTKEIQLSAADQVHREAVEQARKDAGVIPTMAGGVHESPSEFSNQEELEAAAAVMRNTGDGARWRAMTIGKDLTGPWFS